jgi:large subunit ribosomal protein L13
MKTYQSNNKTIKRRWHLIDAKDQVLGRLASNVSRMLMGKDKAAFTPHVDCGDHIIIINAQGVRITGNNKPTQKIDFRHSGYPGGDVMTPYSRLMEEKPDRAIRLAVSGMLPKTRLRSRYLSRLKIYKGAEHPHNSNLQPAVAAAASTN